MLFLVCKLIKLNNHSDLLVTHSTLSIYVSVPFVVEVTWRNITFINTNKLFTFSCFFH